MLVDMKSNAANFSHMVEQSVGSLVKEIRLERMILQEMAVDLGRFPGIEYVEIFDKDGSIIAHTMPSRVGGKPSPEHLPLVNQVFRVGLPVDISQPDKNRHMRFVPITNKDRDAGEVIGVAEVVMKTTRNTSKSYVENITSVVINAVVQQLSHLRNEQDDLKQLLALLERLEGVEDVEIHQEQVMLRTGKSVSQAGGEQQAVASSFIKQVFQTGRAIDLLDINKGHYQLYSPILEPSKGGGEVLGVVKLDMSLSQVLTKINEMQQELAWTALLLACALLITLVWMVRRILIKPLRTLAGASRLIGQGNFAGRIAVSSGDELGELANSFNSMTIALQDSHRRLLCAQEELEQRVDDRTAELSSEKERLRVTLRAIGDAVVSTDAKGEVEFLNPVAEFLTGWRTDEVYGKPLGAVFHIIDEVSRTTLPDPVKACLYGDNVCQQESFAVLVDREGKEIAIEVKVTAMCDDHGIVTGAVLVFRDVGMERKLRRQLQHQANHDALTGLHNRRMFEQELEHAIRDVQADGQPHVVLFLDLDQFKVVNDTCGHVAGDALLIQLTSLLRDKMRATDILARLGGDEFGVILRDCKSPQGVRVAEQLLATVHDFRFVWEDKTFELGVSIGMVVVDDSCLGSAAVMSAADVACYAAKDSGRNRIHIYEPNDEDLARRHGEMQWVSLLSKALLEDRFVLYQQVIQSLDPGVDEMHCEILLRMQAEDGSLIPPGAFIPAAERYNLMVNIDRWVIRKVFSYYVSYWREKLPLRHLIAINLSGTSLNDEGLYDYICQQLDEYALQGDPFCFEITETAAVANLVRASDLIKRLKSRGCKFSLDDFGSGVSSFSYLKNLPVDFLKIDGGFVRDMVHDRVDYAMVEAIHRIGHVMGIKTIAEYVETEAVLDALHLLGVDYGQGYFIARPALLHEVAPSVSDKTDG